MEAVNHDQEFENVVLQNYLFLQENGILEYIDDRNEQIRYLHYVIDAAREIVNQPDTITMLDKVANSFLDRFVPSYLTFVLENEVGGDRPNIITYQNMKQTEPPIQIPSITPYQFYFRLSPVPVTFKVFEYMIGNSSLTDVFKAVDAELVVPIAGFDQVYGFIIVGKKMLGGEYGKYEIEYVNNLMHFTSIALQNSIHYSRAIIDLKTRLYNHAFVMNRFDIELDRVKRYGSGLAIIIIDVDHFKRFNDSYGHLTGDKILQRISEILVESVRKGDVPGRFGGEEFVILLPNCGKLDACLVAERIRKNVANMRMEEQGQQLSVTISLGIRHVTPETIRPIEQLVREADKALYHSKQNGRNKSTIASIR